MTHVHINKFHHSLRNVNIPSEITHRPPAFWSNGNIPSNFKEDENKNAFQYPFILCE